MARLNARWFNFTKRGQAWDHFWQDASVAGGAPPVTCTATFTQAAATWAATDSELFTSTASFVQAAATWVAADSEIIVGTATFSQATTSWDAQAFTSAAVSDGGGHSDRSWYPPLVFDEAQPIFATASFIQAAASWQAMLDVNDDTVMLGLTEQVLQLV